MGAVGLAVAVPGWIAWAQIQTVDEIVTTARQEAALPPVAEKTIPAFTLNPTSPPGTYWLLQTDTPPLPFNPFPELTVYPLGDGGAGAVYLVDDRSVDYPGLWAWQALEAQAQRLLESSPGDGLTLMNLESGGPPFPGEGGTNDPPVDDPPAGGLGYGSNDLWLEILAVATNTGFLRIHTPASDGEYDLFCTTNLSPHGTGLNLTHWQWLWRTAVGQTNLTVTNLVGSECYFVLGVTNDTDGGGWSDAFERLVSHTDPDNPDDDRATPWVGLMAVGSVALEQYPTNTATWRVTRLGGLVSYPLTVTGSLSGTATPGVDYTVSGAGVTGTNVTVQFASGQTSVELTVTAQSDAVVEGTETATLTLDEQAAWEVNPAQARATVWIVEGYTKVYTLDADFHFGVLAGLEAVSNQLQFQTNLPAQFPFINVACSGRGTVARINTTNGQVIGEYLTAPTNTTPSPSRTTVDQFGNVWVANRTDHETIQGVSHGSITRIGLIIGGTRYVKDGTNYTENPLGQYVKLDTCEYNTCIDRDGDGYIRTSRGLADILPWTNQRGGQTDVDSWGGVSTAADEAITEYVRVPCTGTRTIAVDKFNDAWVGGHTGRRTHLKINGLTGEVVPDSAFDALEGGYGGVMDAQGNLWSSPNGMANSGVVWLRPPPLLPPTTNDWQVLFTGAASPYGIAVDPLHSYIWQTSEDSVFRWHTDGTPVTNAWGTVILHPHGGRQGERAKGLAVDGRGHVWVAHGDSATTVGHLDTNGTHLGNIQMELTGLRGEYFANTNLSGTPARVLVEGEPDFDWGHGSPHPSVPTNYFSARWIGVLQAQQEGEHVFFVSADAGAAFQLRLAGELLIDNWTAPATNAVEWSAPYTLYTNYAPALVLEYIEFTDEARVKLAWTEPGSTNKVVIPVERFQQSGFGPSGVSVDTAGKVWVGNYGSHNAMRIDPQAGVLVLTTNALGGVTNVVTNYVGLVDLVVDLGDGKFHAEPYDKPAWPYNYSDMTGFNNRIVNPGGQPLKGYWTVMEDSGRANEFWERVSWNAALTNGGRVEVWVRAGDDRIGLANEPFLRVSNNVPLIGVNGRFLEVRLALVRDQASQQPVLYDLTLHGRSTVWTEGGYVDYWWPVFEGEDVVFWPVMEAPGPFTYQWYALYPWANDFVPLLSETNATLLRLA